MLFADLHGISIGMLSHVISGNRGKTFFYLFESLVFFISEKTLRINSPSTPNTFLSQIYLVGNRS
jgi:hypothetical protein